MRQHIAAVLITIGIMSVLGTKTLHAEKTKLAVLDLEGKGVSESLAENLTDVVTVSLNRLGVFSVLSRSDIKSMLSFESDKQMLGCSSDTSCLAEIGGALGVALLVSGSIGKVGSQYILNLTLTDTKSVKIVEREQRQVKGTEDKLIAELESATRYLVRSLLEGKQGFLVIKASESGSEVEIDGKLIGMTPLQRQVLSGGPHKISVSKKGFITWAKDINIEQDKTEVLDVSLIPSMEFIEEYDNQANSTRMLAWITGGVGGAMALASGGVYYTWHRNKINDLQQTYEDNNNCADPSIPACQDYEEQIGNANRMNWLLPTIGWVGAVALGVGSYLFFSGPEPGIYDIYKTQTKVSANKQRPKQLSFDKVDISPMPNGGALTTAHFSF